MTCWDTCGYRWREVGESDSCTRDINDGTVVNARLTIEVIDIRYDPSGDEDVDHQFDGIVRIYQLYDGDVYETLVYENVDIFHYSSYKIYYKYNEWEVYFYDIRQGPDEVEIKINNKALCPGCAHPYICDCEETIGWEQSAWTYAPAATNNPAAEWIYVKLLDIEAGRTSIRVEIEIWRDSTIVYTDPSAIINNGSYIDISDSSTEHDWRVACNDILLGYQVTVQLCFNFNDSGEGSGSTGDGLVAAQYFNSTGFGWTCGCVINAVVDNPLHGYGKNTVPTEVQLDVHAWQGTYLTTKSTTPLSTQTIITPTEAMENEPYWMTFMWDTDLPPGEYMWVITCLRGPRDGSFRLIYINYGPYQRDQAFVNGYSHRDFYSRIIGVATDESYQKVINKDDTFSSNYYIGVDGHSKIKMKTGTDYKNTMTTECNYGDVKRAIGIVGGENLSFETGDLTGWDARTWGNTTINISDEWSSDGTYSAKFYMPAWDGESCMISQHMDSTVLLPGWQLMWDTYASGSGTYALNIYCGGLIYDSPVPNGEVLNNSVNISSATYLYMKLDYYCCNIDYSRTIYIDNIRFVAPDESTTPIGRVVGGANNINVG